MKSGIDKFLDDLYYIKDLLCLGNSHLSTLVTHKLLGLLVVPILIPMQLGKNTVRGLLTFFNHFPSQILDYVVAIKNSSFC